MDFMEDGAAHTLSSAIQKESNMRHLMNKKFWRDLWFFIRSGKLPCMACRLALITKDNEEIPEFLKDQA